MNSRTIILRTATHQLVAAFTSALVDHFMVGPMKAPPDVIFWGSRVFMFSTMKSDESITYTEAFSFALVEGSTANHLSREEMNSLPNFDPPPAA